MLIPFVADPQRPRASKAPRSAAIAKLERLVQAKPQAEPYLAKLIETIQAGRKLNEETMDGLLGTDPEPIVNCRLKMRALGSHDQTIVEWVAHVLDTATNPEGDKWSMESGTHVYGTPGGRQRTAARVITAIAHAVLNREQQAALGLQLTAGATGKERRGYWNEQTIDADCHRTARLNTLRDTMDLLNDQQQQYAVDFVVGVAAHEHDPQPFRKAISNYARAVLGLGDLTTLLRASARQMERWALAAGAKRPAFPKAGRPRKAIAGGVK